MCDGTVVMMTVAFPLSAGSTMLSLFSLSGLRLFISSRVMFCFGDVACLSTLDTS